MMISPERSRRLRPVHPAGWPSAPKPQVAGRAVTTRPVVADQPTWLDAEAAILCSLTISGQEIPAAALAERLRQLLKRGWAEQRHCKWRQRAPDTPVEL